MERIFVAIGGYCWGKGLSATEAKRQARKQGAKKGTKFAVWRLPKGAIDVFVNGMGGIQWTWMEGADQDQEAEVVERPKARI